MEITVVQGNITELKTDAVVVNLFEGVKQPGGGTGAVDMALDRAISNLIADGELTGKEGEIVQLHTMGKIAPKRVVVVGLGKKEKFDEDTVRRVMGGVCRNLRAKGVRKVATIVHGAGIGGMDAGQSACAIAEGSLLGTYRFSKHRTTAPETGEIQTLKLVEVDDSKLAVLEAGVEKGKVIAEAANLARDMANEPANYMTPTDMAAMAERVAEESGLEVEVLDEIQMDGLGMGAIAGVAKGTHQPPKFIILRYRGAGDGADKNIGLVGKGVTFDSGGISLKPAGNMGEMKGDMSGGASVIATMGAIGKLKPKINVTGLVPSSSLRRAARPLTTGSATDSSSNTASCLTTAHLSGTPGTDANAMASTPWSTTTNWRRTAARAAGFWNPSLTATSATGSDVSRTALNVRKVAPKTVWWPRSSYGNASRPSRKVSLHSIFLSAGSLSANNLLAGRRTSTTACA